MNVALRALLCALLLTVALPAQKKKSPQPPTPSLDKVALESYIRHLNLWTPEIKVELKEPTPSEALPGFLNLEVKASLGERYAEQKYVISPDGKTLIRGDVFSTKDNPFQREISMMNNGGQPAMGTPGAPVVLTVFTDFQCPYCRDQAKSLRENLLKAFPKQVRLYMHDFPLEQIHPWARSAAIASRCVYNTGEENYWKFHDWIFDSQSNVTEATLRPMVMQWAPGNGIEAIQLGRCIDSKETEPAVDKDLATARSLGVNSTPTLFINGRKLASSIPWEQLKKYIEFEIKYQETAKNAGDTSCCSVSLPIPGAAKPQ
jgi:protein-disulfide isomerase